MRSRMWWVADRDKPYLLKYAHDEQFVILGTWIFMKNLLTLKICGSLESIVRPCWRTKISMQKHSKSKTRKALWLCLNLFWQLPISKRSIYSKNYLLAKYSLLSRKESRFLTLAGLSNWKKWLSTLSNSYAESYFPL